MPDYFANKGLMVSPTKRAAYSDRTSYLMAEMSRLAYFKFEGGNNLDEIIEQVKKLIPENEKLPALEALIKARVQSSTEKESKAILTGILDENGFTLVETFNDSGTGAQAFLCERPSQDMAILAFRGTELNLKDIKADTKSRLVSIEKGGNKKEIHNGYLDQFNSLRVAIEAELKKPGLKDRQLFITGHSLGGALAITAVKILANDITGACYTFGSPPVGTKTFDYDIKTPIYRVINHVDIVPRLPNPTMIFAIRLFALAVGVALSPFAKLVSRIEESAWYKKVTEVLVDAQKYRQSGYGSYLVGEGDQARLRLNVSGFDKIRWWVKQFANIFQGDFKLLTDHSIETYSRKLASWAERRSS